jgi:hypothetical protein
LDFTTSLPHQILFNLVNDARQKKFIPPTVYTLRRLQSIPHDLRKRAQACSG